MSDVDDAPAGSGGVENSQTAKPWVSTHPRFSTQAAPTGPNSAVLGFGSPPKFSWSGQEMAALAGRMDDSSVKGGAPPARTASPRGATGPMPLRAVGGPKPRKKKKKPGKESARNEPSRPAWDPSFGLTHVDEPRTEARRPDMARTAPARFPRGVSATGAANPARGGARGVMAPPAGAGFAPALLEGPGSSIAPVRPGQPTPLSAYALVRRAQADREDRDGALSRVRDKQHALEKDAAGAGALGGDGKDRAVAAKLDAERLQERQRIRERERELERERQRERERMREADLRAEHEFELERKLMMQRRQDLETEMELELEEERMREEQRRVEWEEEREREWQFFQDMEMMRERAWERDRELEKDRLGLRLVEKDQEAALERELDRARLEERNREWEMERARWRSLAEQRELELERERQALREVQAQRERELDRDIEHVKLRQRELDERAHRQFELRLLQERVDFDDSVAFERESALLLERQERRAILLDWERELAWEKEKAKARERLLERERRYAEDKLADLQRLEEFELECARLRQRELEFEEQRRLEWELERDVEREREREWAIERQREIERQQAWEHERLLQREREEDRLVLEDLFADQLLLEDIEWDERKAVMRTESEALQDILMEFLAVPPEEIFNPEMTEAERLLLEDDLQREHDDEYAALSREIAQHNEEAQEVWTMLQDAAARAQAASDEQLRAAAADLIVEYRAWATALICEEERQRRMIVTAERLERGAAPPAPMTVSEWDVAMAWNQHQRELLETYYAEDPPAFLMQLQQLQFQYLIEQRALRDQLDAAAREAHALQVEQWNAYLASKHAADSQRAMLDDAVRKQQLASQHAALVQQQAAEYAAQMGRDPSAALASQYGIPASSSQADALAAVGSYRPTAMLPQGAGHPGLPGATYAPHAVVLAHPSGSGGAGWAAQQPVMFGPGVNMAALRA